MAITSAPESVVGEGRPDPGAASLRTEELYRCYGRMIGGLCRALLRNRAEAEDATQQVFLSAHRALLNGSEPREPAAWLATIARNECWSRARERMREPLAVADVDVDASGTLPDPLAEAIRRADLAALWRAIRALPRQQRDAILLREFGGLSYGELAEALAISGGAVESLLFRARRRLREAYAAVAGDGSWLQSLGRLVAGGSAPLATKAVALGLGAAALSGGAVLAPRAFLHGSPSPSHRRPSARPGSPTPPTSSAAALLPLFGTTKAVAVSRTRSERSGRGDGSPERRDGEATTLQTSGDRSGSGDGRGDAAVGATDTSGEHTTATSGGGDGGSVATGGDGGSFATGSDGGSSATGSDGGTQSSGGDGGSTTTTQTTTTQTTTTQTTTTESTTTAHTTTTETTTAATTTSGSDG